VRVVAEGRASLGVCWDNVDFQGLECRPYRTDELALVVPPGHALAARAAVRFEQTLEYEHVGLPPNAAVHAMLQRATARSGRAPVYRAVVSSFDAALRVVAADLGIAVIPRQIAARHAREGAVRVVRLTDPWAARRFNVCVRDRGSLHPAAGRLFDFLVQQAATEAAPWAA
jgi:DNA-binding transcriptional LysR family regulator